MTPEQAREEVKKWIVNDDNTLTHKVADIKKLPKKLQSITGGLYFLDIDWKRNYQNENMYKGNAMEAFLLLSAADQKKIMKALIGDMANDVETLIEWDKKRNGLIGVTQQIRSIGKNRINSDSFYKIISPLLPLVHYDASVLTSQWVAEWVGYLRYCNHYSIGSLFAALIDKGDKKGLEIFDTLCQAIKKEHPVAQMHSSMLLGLMQASREEGWELIENLLLAAQRQEGLRQSILTATTDAHPEAFKRMIRLIVDNDMTRFSSVIKAFDGWYGMQWSSLAAKKVKNDIEFVLKLLESIAATKKALSSKEAEEVYFALYVMAFSDADSAVDAALKFATHKSTEHRFAAVTFLYNVHTEKSYTALMSFLDDDDVRVTLVVLGDRWHLSTAPEEHKHQLFETAERLLEKAPDKTIKLEPLIWPWTENKWNKTAVADLLSGCIGKRCMVELQPYLKAMSPDERMRIPSLIEEHGEFDKEHTDLLIELLADSSKYVRGSAHSALTLSEIKLNAENIETLSTYLTRTTADLRSAVMELILNANDTLALKTANTLVGSKNKNQRLSGLELARQLFESDRKKNKCVEIAQAYKIGFKKLTAEESVQLDALLSAEQEELTLKNCLGLADIALKTPIVAPKIRDVASITNATKKLVKSLDDFINKNRSVEVTSKKFGGGTFTTLLGSSDYRSRPYRYKPIKPQLAKFSEAALVQEWYENLPASCKDKDGFHLLRAIAWTSIDKWDFEAVKSFAKKGKEHKKLFDFLYTSDGPPVLRYPEAARGFLAWAVELYRPDDAGTFVLDVAETLDAMMPEPELQALTVNLDSYDKYDDNNFRGIRTFNYWLTEIRHLLRLDSKDVKDHWKRYWNLARWLDEPIPGAARDRPYFDDIAKAHHFGWVNSTDLHDFIIGEHADGDFYNLGSATTRYKEDSDKKDFKSKPEISSIINSITDRLFEIEIARGETDTVASEPILSVEAFYGIDRLIQLLAGLGKKGILVQDRFYRPKNNRNGTFSKMIKRFYPSESDTPADFKRLMKAAVKSKLFPDERLLHLAFYAPQWRNHVEHYFGWQGFTEGMYWFMAHMKYIGGLEDAFFSDETLQTKEHNLEAGSAKKLSRWERIIRERSPLTEQERYDGAIDVNWFRATYKELTPKRWLVIADAARYAANGAQAKRAQMVADVLTGTCPKKTLVDAIKKRNLKENVRLLGLLPLATGKQLEKDLHGRYEVMQSYKSYASKLSSMSRPEAMQAAEIGMRNLASTAGYSDPTRLQWALEAKATEDLAKGPIVVQKDDVSLTLELNDETQPVLSIARGSKALKSLPKALNKDTKFVELKARHSHLKIQASRINRSLEETMCRCDELTGAELQQLAGHALLWPKLQRLVLVTDGRIGYPDKAGKSLRDYQGKHTSVKNTDSLRIAHPHDLLKSMVWPKWQKECLASNRQQPFKQIFRELYLTTTQEKKDKDHSNRYAGHQVNRRQAFALWGQRDWSRDEYDNVWKAFYNVPFYVRVEFNHGYTTPLEVEGLTVDKILFFQRYQYTPTAIKDVPPVLFSEIMRDLDLIVSVAHVGEVDPEASASTVEMRSALLHESCKLLKLENVELKTDRAFIKGKLGEYTVHLGSGVVHKIPGGSVCLVPVHAQHRGRLFLPFVDDDPRTAEIISKTILLAKDDEIDDPVLLDEIRR